MRYITPLKAARGTGAALAIDDASLGEIIRRHFDADRIAHDRSDAKASHPAGRIGDQAVIVFQHDAETAIGQDFVDHPFEGEKFLFRQGQAG